MSVLGKIQVSLFPAIKVLFIPKIAPFTGRGPLDKCP
jgi:hypothetical protein